MPKSSKPIYLDYAATTPTDPRVVSAMEPFFTKKFGNPSSIHSFGQEIQNSIDIARSQVSMLFDKNPSNIIFTSSATEANNWVLENIFSMFGPDSHIITTQIEHKAVLEKTMQLDAFGVSVSYVSLDSDGLVEKESLMSQITDQTQLVSIQYVNSEIGTVQLLADLLPAVRKQFPNVLVHIDAVQAAPYLSLQPLTQFADFITISAHKMYGPKGIAAFWVRDPKKLQPMLVGGGQEYGKRSSTENVPGIVGMGEACDIALKEYEKDTTRVEKLRNEMIKQLKKIPDTAITGSLKHRSPNNIHVRFGNLPSDLVVIALDRAGIAASTGSACQIKASEESYVLTAVGLSDEEARTGVRFTLGKYTTKEEIKKACSIITKTIKSLS